ncbi:MAG: hypothetical protein AB9869_05405 [Verrucomicrobiia bacterium]
MIQLKIPWDYPSQWERYYLYESPASIPHWDIIRRFWDIPDAGLVVG